MTMAFYFASLSTNMFHIIRECPRTKVSTVWGISGAKMFLLFDGPAQGARVR